MEPQRSIRWASSLVAASSPTAIVPNPHLQNDSDARTSPALLLPPPGGPGVHCPPWRVGTPGLEPQLAGTWLGSTLHPALTLAQPVSGILMTPGRFREPRIGQEEVVRVGVPRTLVPLSVLLANCSLGRLWQSPSFTVPTLHPVPTLK